MSWSIDESKFLSPQEVKKLRKFLSTQARAGGVRAKTRWFVTDFFLSTGARCFEGAQIQIEDCHVDYGQSSIVIREGKNKKTATVIIGPIFKTHIKQYIKWRGVATGPLLLSERGKPYTRSGLQKMMKRIFKEISLPEHHSIHTLRHTFISTIYRNTQNIMLWKAQARHSSVATTQVYSHLLSEEIEKGMEGLYE